MRRRPFEWVFSWLHESFLDWMYDEDATSNMKTSTDNNIFSYDQQQQYLYSQLISSSFIGLFFLSIHVMAPHLSPLSWNFMNLVSVEAYFLFTLRLLVILFSMGNYWWISRQWKEYSLEFVDPTNTLYSPHSKKIQGRGSKSTEQVLVGEVAAKSSDRDPNAIHFPPFEKHSLQIWQPSFNAMCMACTYSPIHIFVIELRDNVFPETSFYLVLLLLGSLSFSFLFVCLQFCIALKDREILFQQVMREYNMKFVYPTLTRLNEFLEKERQEKFEWEQQQQQQQQNKTGFSDSLRKGASFERNPFMKTPEPEDVQLGSRGTLKGAESPGKRRTTKKALPHENRQHNGDEDELSSKFLRKSTRKMSLKRNK